MHRYCKYKVSVLFIAPIFSCEFGKWTTWFNSDYPSVEGDFETLTLLRRFYPDMICNNPIGIEVRREADGMMYDPTNPNILANLKTGFQCRSLPDQPCEDYCVRFCCPTGEPCYETALTSVTGVIAGRIEPRHTIRNCCSGGTSKPSLAFPQIK